MPWIQVVDGILGLKLVKWGLLILAVLLIVAASYLKFSNVMLGAKAKTLEAERDSARIAIQMQNESVQAWKADADRFKAKVGDSQKAADTVAAEVRKTLADLSQQNIPSDCTGAVDVGRNFMAVQR